METVNGKLINQKLKLFEEFTQIAEKINQRCESLESQVNTITKHDYMEDLQKVSDEVSSSKSYLQKLEQKIGFLEEEVTSTKAKYSLFIKISSVIGLVALWLIFSANNQPKHDKKQPRKRAETMELIQPEYRNLLKIIHLSHLKKGA
ncbi:MAG: hypothetical protein HWQ38_08635 [Nostoc sp. NMS7]|uniref:hypothetical protein n=1 Tax=unclassified Nostoc TaxID=2593658 RepID=UPI0025EF41F0|nr:hypothetical protein [Nostoc sp. NMS7]MBN3946548.1 hypothetical protein [Nostoc sp. NMS7]